AAGLLLKQRPAVGADPRFVDIGGAVGYTILDHGREGAADRGVPIEMLDYLGHDIADRIRQSGVRRLEPKALGRQIAALDVHGGAFDAASADVDPKNMHKCTPHRRMLWLRIAHGCHRWEGCPQIFFRKNIRVNQSYPSNPRSIASFPFEIARDLVRAV